MHGTVGRTVGLVGYGGIPRSLAPILAALGARVLYTARGPKQDAVGEWCVLRDLLRESDIVSLHVPLTEETGGMVDRHALELMKPGTILINTGRGEVVDHPALCAALESGRHPDQHRAWRSSGSVGSRRSPPVGASCRIWPRSLRFGARRPGRSDPQPRQRRPGAPCRLADQGDARTEPRSCNGELPTSPGGRTVAAPSELS